MKAILPDELSNSYLETLHVPLTDIHQVWLPDPKMPYTPVVGRDGLVRDVWVGRLGEWGEKQVMTKLGTTAGHR